MKTILVTGGNKGIGLEICRQLDEQGHRVIMGSRDTNKGKEAASSASSNLIVKRLDVTSEESIQDLFEYVCNTIGSLDVLINNAGLGPNYKKDKKSVLLRASDTIETKYFSLKRIKYLVAPILRNFGMAPEKDSTSRISLPYVKEIMETNLYGAWRMAQVFVPLLAKSENGRIINISSGAGKLNSLTGEYPAYSLSKSSLNGLTLMLSNELQEKSIKVNAMCPGWVKTDMGGPDAPRHVSEGADTAVWLATEEDIPTGKFFRDRVELNW